MGPLIHPLPQMLDDRQDCESGLYKTWGFKVIQFSHFARFCKTLWSTSSFSAGRQAVAHSLHVCDTGTWQHTPNTPRVPRPCVGVNGALPGWFGVQSSEGPAAAHPREIARPGRRAVLLRVLGRNCGRSRNVYVRKNKPQTLKEGQGVCLSMHTNSGV